MVAQQFYEREKNNRLMIAILSQVTERHNGENGLHLQRIQTLTAMLLEQLVLKTDRYVLPASERSLITTASALHDIGKIANICTQSAATKVLHRLPVSMYLQP